MKNTLLTFFAVLFSINISLSQDVYNIDSIRDLNLHFYDIDWRDSLDSYYIQGLDSMVLADLTINGTNFDSVGVRWKGNSSCSAGQLKNPLHIELDFIKNQDYFGVSTFKLSNLFKDPSFVREVVMYEFLNWYMPASQSNYVNVYIDGSLLGFYVSTKSLNKDFMEEYFGSRNNARFKCDPLSFTSPPPPIPGCGPPPPNASAALLFFSPDTACYQYSYEMKSDYGWQNLLTLMETVRFDSTNARNILDVDRTLWMLAFDNLFSNLDSYIGSGHNYYLYQNDAGIFNPIIWDLNEVFGTFTEGMNYNDLKNLSLFYKTDMFERPLLKSLLSIPNNRKKYLAHYRTLVKELIETDTIVERCNELQTMIDSYVQADPNKLTTYTEFQNSINTDQALAMGISTFLSDRYNFVSSDNDYLKTSPTIVALVPPTSVLPTDSVNISAIITNAEYCTLGYRIGKFQPFIYIDMFDDGNHNDGAANDGVFAAEIPPFPSNTQVDYYIYAENSEAGVFLPARAEYEFFNYIVSGETIYAGKIVINEFLASNSTIQDDQDNEFDDWIELFNPTSEDISLRSVYLSDDTSNVLKWQFPDTLISANSYLIIWADNDITQNGLHANFKISSSGEELVLANFDESIIDSISFGVQSVDTSYGRYPNAVGEFQVLKPTFSALNEALNIKLIDVFNDILVYPNPTNDFVVIKTEKNRINKIRIINIVGKIENTYEVNNINEVFIDLSELEKGLYFISIEGDYGLITKKIVKE